jgi:imidazole glycerol-phosphate synthase subunit HisH
VNVGIIDYGMGNLRSVSKALEAAGARATLVSQPDDVDAYDALCVPGQGIFGRCMDNLSAAGMAERIATWIESERPYLGICLGMQILFESSEERGPREGLGLLKGAVARLSGDVRIPHIGWNTVSAADGRGEYFYFDHSYAVKPSDRSMVEGWCEHGETFAASISSGAITAVQFHPEKSGEAGIDYLEGWVKRI